MRWAGVLCLLAQTVSAEQTCSLQNEACVQDCAIKSVRFAVDPNQFVAPQDPNDPPRRQVTDVTMDTVTFRADAILFAGGVTGFYDDATSTGTRLMIVQRDGAARLVLQPFNEVWVGTCVD